MRRYRILSMAASLALATGGILFAASPAQALSSCKYLMNLNPTTYVSGSCKSQYVGDGEYYYITVECNNGSGYAYVNGPTKQGWWNTYGGSSRADCPSGYHKTDFWMNAWPA